jgi:predicted RNA binding protein YcfA (HicA-like mRNA interferase family)
MERAGVSITIAGHGGHPVGRGLLAAILKAAQMSPDDLRRLL